MPMQHEHEHEHEQEHEQDQEHEHEHEHEHATTPCATSGDIDMTDTHVREGSIKQFKTLDTGCGAGDTDIATCACTSPSEYISYNSGGCLSCVKADMAYLISNFSENLLELYHVTY
mgnify:CR=1 FL=1